ncbi:hypothetical protein KC363_g199 [Hortaea werneckii]|nr:hypothetical protein KC363_g199 [Hortaea werneckii]
MSTAATVFSASRLSIISATSCLCTTYFALNSLRKSSLSKRPSPSKSKPSRARRREAKPVSILVVESKHTVIQCVRREAQRPSLGRKSLIEGSAVDRSLHTDRICVPRYIRRASKLIVELRLTSRAEIKIRAVQAMPSDTSNWSLSTLFTGNSSVLVALPFGILLSDIVEKSFDSLAGLMWSAICGLEVFGLRKIRTIDIGVRLISNYAKIRDGFLDGLVYQVTVHLLQCFRNTLVANRQLSWMLAYSSSLMAPKWFLTSCRVGRSLTSKLNRKTLRPYCKRMSESGSPGLWRNAIVRPSGRCADSRSVSGQMRLLRHGIWRKEYGNNPTSLLMCGSLLVPSSRLLRQML